MGRKLLVNSWNIRCSFLDKKKRRRKRQEVESTQKTRHDKTKQQQQNQQNSFPGIFLEGNALGSLLNVLRVGSSLSPGGRRPQVAVTSQCPLALTPLPVSQRHCSFTSEVWHLALPFLCPWLSCIPHWASSLSSVSPPSPKTAQKKLSFS